MEFKVSFQYFFRRYSFLILYDAYLTFHYFMAHDRFNVLDIWAYRIIPIFEVILIYMDYRRWRKFLFGTPVLIINDELIYDVRKEVKYYWKDIKEISVNDLGRISDLEIRLYDSRNYLERIGDKRYRNEKQRQFRKKGEGAVIFSIGIYCIDVKPADMEQILRSYSDSPVDRKNAVAFSMKTVTE